MKIFLIAMLFLAAPCVADDVKSVLGKSTFAGVVSITAGNQMPYEDSELSDCGLRYTAYANAEQVFVNKIGWVEGYPIEFRAAWMLELGGRYLVFLNETAAGTADAIRNERELRTERCMGGGLQLVPVLVNTQTFAWGGVFQEWRTVENENGDGGREYLDYILAISDFSNFFRPTSEENGEPLDSVKLEIRTSHGPLNRDAYLRDEVLDLVARVACESRESHHRSTNSPMIADCEM